MQKKNVNFVLVFAIEMAIQNFDSWKRGLSTLRVNQTKDKICFIEEGETIYM